MCIRDRKNALQIKIESLTYKYSVGTPFEQVAVDNVSLEIAGGEMVGVIGHTGSGKSTLIQHLNGLLRPTSGTVYLDGRDIWADKSKLRQVRFDVGLVFQYPEYQLFEETVYKDIVEFAGKVPAFDCGAYYSDVRSALTDAVTNIVQNNADIDSEMQNAQDTVEFNIAG